MDSQENKQIEPLEWLAFIAQQRGWDELVERIAADLSESKKRQDELEQRWFESFGEDHGRNAA